MNSHSIRHFLLGGVVILAWAWGSLSVSAQRQAWNWYFGNRAGITFRSGVAEPLSDGVISTAKGCATQSDPVTGELQFYTDGVTVWNRLHEPMANGTGLHGDATTSQSALIVPVPGSMYLFYVFNAAPVSSPNPNGRCLCLTYSIVDMRRDNGFGDVVTKNQVVADDITEHLTATKHCGDGTYWIVVRNRSSRHFLSYKLTPERLEPTAVISDASNPSLVVRSGGQMHLSPNGRKLVITSTSGNSQLYDFNPATGKVTNGINLFPDDPQGVHYGAAFTADNRYVYVAVNNRSRIPNEIFRFRTDLPTAAQTVTSRQFVRSLGLVPAWLPMQLAPDSAIYIGRPGEQLLSAILRASRDDLDSIIVREAAVTLSGRCQSGLPNLIGSSILPYASESTCDIPQADVSVPTLCAGNCVSFQDASRGRIDSWQWFFEGADPATSTNRNPPRVCYSYPGSYRVRLVVSNENGADTATRTITVLPKPRLTVPSEISICRGSTVRLTASGAASYRWTPSDGLSDPTSATPTAAPTSTTRYTVVGVSEYGCIDSATVLVRVPVMQAGPDVSVCRGDTVTLRAFGAQRYSWSPTIGLSDPTAANPVARPMVTTRYVVTMQADTCVVVDTLEVTVIDSLRVSINAPSVVCAGDTAQLVASGSKGVAYRWEPASAVSDPTSATPWIRISERTVLRVTASSGSCTATDSVVIDVLQRPAVTAVGNATICPGAKAPLRAITTARAVRWYPSASLDNPASRTPVAYPDSTTTYVVEVFDDSSCVARDSVTVIVVDLVQASAGADKAICRGNAVQLSGTGPTNATYTWAPATGLDDPTALAPIASPAVTTTYVLTIDAGTCVLTDTVTVFVSTLNVDVSADTTICMGESVRLLAQGGASRYTWIPAKGLSDPTIANPVASPSITTRYVVVAEDPFGCRNEASVTVFVRDTVPIKLRLGTVSARAGEDALSVPVFADADPSLLPIQIDELRAEINCDLTVFMPESVERGDVVVGRTSDGRSVVILTMRNIQLLLPSQRLTTITGRVLLGNSLLSPLVWESVAWQGEFCPTVSTTNGALYVSGCFIEGRMIRYFGEASFRLVPRMDGAAVDIVISGSEPGLHTARIITTQGKVVWQGAVHRTAGDTSDITLTADVSTLGNGSYLVQLLEPFGSSTTGMTLLR